MNPNRSQSAYYARVAQVRREIKAAARTDEAIKREVARGMIAAGHGADVLPKYRKKI